MKYATKMLEWQTKNIMEKEYDEKFQVLWRSLQREKLVKHSLEELENSDLFKYSPFKELNNDQRTAVEEIVDSLKQENQTVVVNGMPEVERQSLQFSIEIFERQ